MEFEVQQKWVTVDEAFSICVDHGLSRTKKTIRQWCRQSHVEAQKRSTPIGESWMIDTASLNVKIQSEKEFAASHSNPSEPVQTSAHVFTPVQAGANQSAHPQTGANQDQTEDRTDEKQEIESLKKEVRSLEIDKGIRDAQIDFLERENEKGRDALSAQSRYIGHLETLAHLSGSSPDGKFLASALPNPEIDPNIPSVDLGGSREQNLSYNNPHANGE